MKKDKLNEKRIKRELDIGKYREKKSEWGNLIQKDLETCTKKIV